MSRTQSRNIKFEIPSKRWEVNKGPAKINNHIIKYIAISEYSFFRDIFMRSEFHKVSLTLLVYYGNYNY
jgi:hypothetical protein